MAKSARAASWYHITFTVQTASGGIDIVYKTTAFLVGKRTYAFQGPNPPNVRHSIHSYYVAPDRYQLHLEVKGLGGFGDFTIVSMFDGKLIRDPTASFPFGDAPAGARASARAPAGNPPGTPARLLYKYEELTPAHCFLSLDCAQEGLTDIVGPKLTVGGVAFRSGPEAGVPKHLERYYRGKLPPGSHKLALEDPEYRLPTGVKSLVIRSNLVTRRVDLVAPGAPVTSLKARPDAFFVDVGEAVDLAIEPPHALPRVTWTISDPRLLRRDGTTNRFVGVAEGVVTVTAAMGSLQSSVSLFVRGDPARPAMRPVAGAPLDTHPLSGRPVVGGEVIVTLKPGATAEQRRALWRKHRLSVAGEVRAQVSYQLAFEPPDTLRELLAKLAKEPLVAFAVPHAIGGPLTIPVPIASIVPPAVQGTATQFTLRFWSLYKIEAMPAFGLLDSLQGRRLQHIVLIDSGLHVTFTGDCDRHLKDDAGNPRVDWNRSHPFTDWKYIAKRDLNAPEQPTTTDPNGPKTKHGNAIAGVAVARRVVTGTPQNAIGVDAVHSVVMLKVRTNPHITKALEEVAKLVNDSTRVLNIAWGYRTNTPGVNAEAAATAEADASFKDALAQLLKNERLLIVISAGNVRDSYKTFDVACTRSRLQGADLANARARLILVGGTMTRAGGTVPPRDPQDYEEAWSSDGGSAYDNAADRAIDLAAPAHIIWTSSGTSETNTAGTSEAAGFVSGAAAMLFSILPVTTSAAEVKRILIKTADPIHYLPAGATPASPRKLFGNPGEWIGEGRLNVWQALLFALNKRTDGKRYVGLRITADTAGLALWLEKDRKDRQPIGGSVLNEARLSKATRLTITNQTGDFPPFLIARDSNNVEVWKQRLPLDLKEIDSLSPRFVLTRRLFTKGDIKLTRSPAPGPAPHQVPLIVENPATAPTEPTDIEFLDPLAPHDKSIKPWMILANGDAYALSYTVKFGPPGFDVRFLDAALKPFQVENNQSYVQVPFQDKRTVHVEGVFPANAIVLTADVEVEAFSLNNELKKTPPVPVRLRAPAIEAALVRIPPGWIVDGFRQIPVPPTGNWDSKVVLEPATWTGKAAVRPRPANEPWELLYDFKSPANAKPGDMGRLNVTLTSTPRVERFAFPAQLELPDVELVTPNTQGQAGPSGTALMARYTFSVTNKSTFPVYVRGYTSSDTLFPQHAPPAGVEPVLIRFKIGNAHHNEQPLGPGKKLNGEFWIHYAASAASLPPGTVGTRRVRLKLIDTKVAQTVTDPKPSYLTTELVLATVVRKR